MEGFSIFEVLHRSNLEVLRIKSRAETSGKRQHQNNCGDSHRAPCPDCSKQIMVLSRVYQVTKGVLFDLFDVDRSVNSTTSALRRYCARLSDNVLKVTSLSHNPRRSTTSPLKVLGSSLSRAASRGRAVHGWLRPRGSPLVA